MIESVPGPSIRRISGCIEASKSALLRSFISADRRDRPVNSLEESDLGYWHGELEADTTLESDYILFLYYLDPEGNREKIEKLANRIKKCQLEDGSWNIYYGGPGDVSASVKAYFALKLVGVPVDDPIMVRAREAILEMGGADRVNSFTKIYLSFLNQFDWKECPAIPPEIVLLPRFLYFNIYEISYWSRAILVPLSILYDRKPRRSPPPELNIREIFHDDANGAHADSGNGSSPPPPHAPGNGVSGNGAEPAPDALVEAARVAAAAHPGNGGTPGNGRGARRRVLRSIPRDPNVFSWKNFFLLIDQVLKLVEYAPVKPLRNLAVKRAEKWIVERFEKSDGLGAIFPSMVNSVIALHSLGYDVDHPHIANTLEKLRELEIDEGDSIRLQPCLSPVWDTALALNALGEAGLSEDDPIAERACRWLVSKEALQPGDWQVRKPGIEASGWYFQFNNEFYPDVDDTAAVLMALERFDLQGIRGGEETFKRGLLWMLSMQCKNGGWAAFDVDINREILTHVPFADHNAMLDPACVDITGRVLECFGRLPSLREQPPIRRALDRGIEFLRREQEACGAWYGRWGVNYIYGTWLALTGLNAVGVSRDDPMIRKAVSWLKSVQNDDGGWGESCHSYEDPATKGRGESTASQTAWALMGLLAAGETHCEHSRRGVDYLLEHQNADGTWTELEFTGTGFPRVFYLRYHLYCQYFPLFALAMYRNAIHGTPSIRNRKRVDLSMAAARRAVQNSPSATAQESAAESSLRGYSSPPSAERSFTGSAD